MPDKDTAGNTPYDDSFYLGQRDLSYRSAGHVVPIVLSLLPVRSVIDVGCGVGTWAAQFLEHGVNDVVGIDGDYVNRTLLKIPASCFVPCDLSRPIRMARTFDLAACLEVAEHLMDSRAESLVDDLTKLAPVVLFSAAIPGQGGTDHVNEQYLSYWVDHFARRDYVLLDVIRPRIWHQDGCDWVYKQNAVLFARKDQPIAGKQVPSGVDYVHPYHYDFVSEKLRNPTLGYLFKSLPGSVARSFRTRWRRLAGS